MSTGCSPGAQAEEIRTSPAYQHWFTQDRFLAGRGWLEEATLVAESEPVRLRAFQELASRLTVDERLTAANQLLDQAAQRGTSAASITALAQWRTALGGLEQGFQARCVQQEQAAQVRLCRRTPRGGRQERSPKAMRPPVRITTSYCPPPARRSSDRRTPTTPSFPIAEDSAMRRTSSGEQVRTRSGFEGAAADVDACRWLGAAGRQ